MDASTQNDQPPHPTRVGLKVTHKAITDNHKVLDRYAGDVKSYTLLQKIPHNTSWFTQGLAYSDGYLYEGTGEYGASELLQIDPRTGRAHARGPALPPQYFGEGIALDTRRRVLLQLTWRERTGFVYPLAGPPPPPPPAGSGARPLTMLAAAAATTFEYETYTGEGWGMAYNAHTHELVVSDGSEYLFIWDADTLAEKRYLRATLPTHRDPHRDPAAAPPAPSSSPSSSLQRDAPALEHLGSVPLGSLYLGYLNELEVAADGRSVLANVWYSDKIVRIDLGSGVVTAVYDLGKLHTARGRNEDCFNGIALDPASGDFFVTGKKWPWVFRVRLEEEEEE